ncbi:unnamed protein product [Leptosia nina]|uniref:Uncharacterized protein n=1 Tax=Leptosia nina TaxID=320188 RepID=A0AAV1JRG4_9NEOP
MNSYVLIVFFACVLCVLSASVDHHNEITHLRTKRSAISAIKCAAGFIRVYVLCVPVSKVAGQRRASRSLDFTRNKGRSR